MYEFYRLVFPFNRTGGEKLMEHKKSILFHCSVFVRLFLQRFQSQFNTKSGTFTVYSPISLLYNRNISTKWIEQIAILHRSQVRSHRIE